MLSRDQLKTAFDKVDADKSGSIDINELSKICDDLGAHCNMEEVKKLFEEIDLNHDGKVSFDEFTAWWRIGRNTKTRAFLKHALKAQAKVAKFDQNSVSKAGDNMIRLANAQFCYGQTVANTTVQVGTSSSDEVKALVKQALPNFAAENFFFSAISCTNAQAARDGFANFHTAMKDFLGEIEGAPPPEMIESVMAYDCGIAGDKLVFVRDASTIPGFEMADQFLGMGVAVADSMNVQGSIKMSGDNTFTSAHTANVKEMNTPWEFHAQLNVTNDWAVKAKETAVNMMGPEGAEVFDQSPVGLFEDFNLVAKVRKTDDSADAVKAQSQLMMMMCDACPPLRMSPLGEALSQCGEGGLNTDGWNWAQSKEKLQPMVQQMGLSKVNDMPFVVEFINNWCDNVNSECQFGICYQTRQVSEQFKSEGFSLFVKDMLNMCQGK